MVLEREIVILILINGKIHKLFIKNKEYCLLKERGFRICFRKKNLYLLQGKASSVGKVMFLFFTFVDSCRSNSYIE